MKSKCLILLLICGISSAEEYIAPTLREFAVDTRHFTFNRDPMFYANKLVSPTAEVSMNANMSFLWIGYMNNKVVGQSNNGYRFVGWNYEVGVQPTKDISIYFNHFSKHLLDTPSVMPYPIYDSVGIRYVLYSK